MERLCQQFAGVLLRRAVDVRCERCCAYNKSDAEVTRPIDHCITCQHLPEQLLAPKFEAIRVHTTQDAAYTYVGVYFAIVLPMSCGRRVRAWCHITLTSSDSPCTENVYHAFDGGKRQLIENDETQAAQAT